MHPAITDMKNLMHWSGGEAKVADIAFAQHLIATERVFGKSIPYLIAAAIGVGVSAQLQSDEWACSKWYEPLHGADRFGLTFPQSVLLDRLWSGFRRAADFALEVGEISPEQKQAWLDATREALKHADWTEAQTDGA